LKTKRRTVVTDTPDVVPADGSGSVVQVDYDLWKESTVSVSAADVSNITKSFSSGIKTETQVSVSTSSIPPVHGGLEQVGDGLFRRTSIGKSSASFTDKTLTFSGGIKTERKTKVGQDADSTLPGYDSTIQDLEGEGSIEQVAEELYRKVSVGKSGLVDFRVRDSGGLLETIDVSIASVYDPPSHGSVEQVGDALYKNTIVSLEAGTLEGTSWSSAGVYQKKQDVVSVVLSVGSMPTDPEVFASYLQLAPSIYKKTLTTFVDAAPSLSLGQTFHILSKSLTYRTGMVFGTMKTILDFPRDADADDAWAGFSFDNVKDSWTLDKVGRKVYDTTFVAANSAANHIVYDTESFTLPGLYDVTTEGVKVTMPVTRPVHVAKAVTYTDTPVAGGTLLTPPSATVDWDITFRGEGETYKFHESSSNFFYEKSTVCALDGLVNPPVTSCFHSFAGNVVGTSTFSGSGDDYGIYYTAFTSAGGVVLSGSLLKFDSSPIYVAGAVQIYQNVSTYLNEDFTAYYA
jgi:hypothetical protein